jgi:hypothetical protein
VDQASAQQQPVTPAADSERVPFRRTRYLLDRELQLKYAGLFALIGSVVPFFFGLALYFEEANSRDPGLTDPSDLPFLPILIGATLLFAAGLGLLGVLMTHRLVGPAFLLSRYIGILAQGQFPVMRPLRKTDDFKKVFEDFRNAVEVMRQRERDESRSLLNMLTVLEPTATTPEQKSAIDALRALQRKKAGG